LIAELHILPLLTNVKVTIPVPFTPGFAEKLRYCVKPLEKSTPDIG
jgi:hypothetical protein